ncbi:Phenylacetate--CoA ligase [Thermodesulfatator indicus DSM 15286]|uniref:Phenylacetate--CoA ligase n=1 Tax=Thermodesulfatator indicus (strain DSM 15286 / JCM 11887 / CIR29812) TaxID=667014 RepID=F8ADC0_THEID|nr:AMP-binding protein [Thermodesulfatator indicus]AEH45935.1 Phenylacetate--CoA ligase [Thermodesulfatator indicus DSM 15286]
MKPDNAVEYLSQEGWRQWHLELLQSTINRVYHRVPFYRKLMDMHNISPDDIKSLEDMKKLPFTTREHLEENYPYDLFAVPLRDIVRLHTFPGPRTPIVKGFTLRDLSAVRRLTARFLATSGVTSEDIVLICLDPGMSVWISEIKEGAEELGASVIPPDPQSVKNRLKVMRDFRASVLITTPSYALYLTGIMQQEGIAPPKSLRLIVFVGEGIEDEERMRLEQVLGVSTRLGYGVTEAVGPGMGYECDEKNGYHLATDYFIPEIIDPETGEDVPPGEIGELVITTVAVKANPLIRFRTGDMTRFIPEPCPCGRTTPRISPIQAQADGRVSVRGIKISLAYIENLLEEAYGHVPEYVLCIQKKNYLERLSLWVAINEKLFEPSILGLHEVAAKFERLFAETFGLNCRLKLVEKDHLKEVSKGKKIVYL